MSIYLGSLGRLVELKCPATQQVSNADRFSFEESLEGKVFAQARPVGRRVWQLGTSDATTPKDIAAVQAFIDGAWGAGPFVFVSADAPVTNLLTPDAATCSPGNYTLGVEAVVGDGGPMLLPDGWAGRSYYRVSGGDLYFDRSFRTPVISGVQVTGSAYVLGAGAVAQLTFYDASNKAIGLPVKSNIKGNAVVAVRSAVTALPPANAVSCKLSVSGFTRAANPAITWTSQAFDWATGDGCAQAVIHASSRNLVMASNDPRGGRYSNLSYTITEVG